jgi:hypothetical protein
MAYGINSSGNVVGAYYDAGGNSHGFTYDGTNYNAINYSGTGGLRCNFTGSSCNTISLGVSYSGFEANAINDSNMMVGSLSTGGSNPSELGWSKVVGGPSATTYRYQRVHGRPDSRAGQPRAGGPGASIRRGVALAASSMLKGADRRG